MMLVLILFKWKHNQNFCVNYNTHDLTLCQVLLVLVLRVLLLLLEIEVVEDVFDERLRVLASERFLPRLDC